MRISNLKNNYTAIIRQAFKIDAEEIIGFNNKVGGETDFLSFGANGLHITIEQEINYIESINECDNSMMVVAEINKQIVCVASLISSAKDRYKHKAELGICISKDFWGIGLGEQVIKYLIEWAKSNGITTKITLTVRTDNIRAISLYKRLGFEIEGTLRNDIYINNIYYDSYAMGLII